MSSAVSARKQSVYQSPESVPQFRFLPADLQKEISTASSVLPFRTNSYITDELIDWGNIPDDPLFQSNFPQKGMVIEDDYNRLRELLLTGADSNVMESAVNRARMHLLPNESDTAPVSLPTINNRPAPGICHQFRETILAFPLPAVECFSICTYCYRWMKHCGAGRHFCCPDGDLPALYLREHPEVSDIQITGGDPMVMNAEELQRIIAPLLEVESLETIRFSTRALSWWPCRFTTDSDADVLLRVFERISDAGKQCAIMVHVTHPRELSTDTAMLAVRRIRSTGATIYSQAPILRQINDNAATLKRLLKKQVRLGIIPYYLFLDSDAGPRDYFRLPLSAAVDLFKETMQQVSGLARTVRGPVIYTAHYKIQIDDVLHSDGRKYFLLKYLESTDPSLKGECFLADYDESAVRFDNLTLHTVTNDSVARFVTG